MNKEQTIGRLKKIADDKGVNYNRVLLTHFFEAFIKRVADSKYSINFVLKGGFLLSSMIGIDKRTTMDIDMSLRNKSLEEKKLIEIIKEICLIEENDSIKFEFLKSTPIKNLDINGGYNIKVLGKLSNIRQQVSIDIAAGDPITPEELTYTYKSLLFNDIAIKTYNVETILAEKLHTILERGINNSRSKDFYDVFLICTLKGDDIYSVTLDKAINNTYTYRQSTFDGNEAYAILERIKDDTDIRDRWESYCKYNDYVYEVSFDEVLQSCNDILDIVLKIPIKG